MDKTKNVTVNGRNFQIRKFSAKNGAFIAIKVAGLIGPIIDQVDLSKLMNAKKVEDIELNDIHFGKAIHELGRLSEDDFNYLHDKALSVVSEFRPNNSIPVPVVHSDGTYGVEGLEDDPMAVTALMVHALWFNLKGFFQGNALSSIVGKISDTNQQTS